MSEVQIQSFSSKIGHDIMVWAINSDKFCVIYYYLPFHFKGSPAPVDQINDGGSERTGNSSGAVYIRWGRDVCPEGSELVYNGKKIITIILKLKNILKHIMHHPS